MFIGILFITMLNVAAWLIPGLCDWYTIYITPVWVNTYGRFSNLFPFSFGELLLIAGIIIVSLSVIIGIALIFLNKKAGFRKFSVIYYKTMSYILLAVCLIMTLNCSMLYHCKPLDPNPEAEYREYTIDELQTLRNFVVGQCNEYSSKMPRDEKGYVVYEGDMQEQAKRALINISDSYPKLKGYYPDVKKLMYSNLMSQAYMSGYYFPFSMEANCNSNMYITNYPAVYCHELSHLHGYIYEDEANFISYLACIESGDEFFIYCGYLSVLYYIDNAYFESIGEDIDAYTEQHLILPQVIEDNVFLLEETWDEVEETAVFSTDSVDAASDTFTETSLQLNGVKSGLASYGEVVDLLLQYYDGVLY